MTRHWTDDPDVKTGVGGVRIHPPHVRLAMMAREFPIGCTVSDGHARWVVTGHQALPDVWYSTLLSETPDGRTVHLDAESVGRVDLPDDDT